MLLQQQDQPFITHYLAVYDATRAGALHTAVGNSSKQIVSLPTATSGPHVE